MEGTVVKVPGPQAVELRQVQAALEQLEASVNQIEIEVERMDSVFNIVLRESVPLPAQGESDKAPVVPLAHRIEIQAHRIRVAANRLNETYERSEL